MTPEQHPFRPRPESESRSIPSNIRLQNGSLCYDLATGARRGSKWSDPALLQEFVELVEAEDMAIAKFAHRWGVLGLCRHNLPTGHPQLRQFSAVGRKSHFLNVIPKQPNSELSDAEADVCRGSMQNDQCECIESLAAWRFYAKTANETLKRAEVLHRTAKKSTKVKTEMPSGAWQEIRSLIEDWRFIAPLQIGCKLQGGRLTVGLQPVHSRSSLSAILAAQTLFAAARSSGLTTCSACGRLYLLSRRIQEGRRRYCTECGRRAAQRDASRAYRSRQRAIFDFTELRGN